MTRLINRRNLGMAALALALGLSVSQAVKADGWCRSGGYSRSYVVYRDSSCYRPCAPVYTEPVYVAPTCVEPVYVTPRPLVYVDRGPSFSFSFGYRHGSHRGHRGWGHR